MVSVSPRLDYLDSDNESEISSTDPRFTFGFRSLTLESGGYEEHEIDDDRRPFAASIDATAGRRRRRRQSSRLLDHAECYHYPTRADGDVFRLVVLQPGTGSSIVQCHLELESSKKPSRNYNCLSYAWGSIHRDAAILCNGFKFSVTSNLLAALQSLRKPKNTVTIWIDQICINQDDSEERAQQVEIMDKIFNQAEKVYIWLGESDDRSDRLCEYAKSMRRGSDENTKTTLYRILSQRELRDAIQKLLQRPWFQRVWVIQEVALASRITVLYGRARITWQELVRLIRDVKLPMNPGFDKQGSLLGNPRQRLAILNQLIASQKDGQLHTDITQLLIMGKSSNATDARDMIYAFYGLTVLRTVPDYSAPLDSSSEAYQQALQSIYVEVAEQYINAILYEASYSSWHKLTEEQKTFQLMSIIFSAGVLHHHLNLPSWVPDWTYPWHLAPVWCRSIPNFSPPAAKDEWAKGIRSDFRAGGDELKTFELVSSSLSSSSPGRSNRALQLHISALLLDEIVLVNEITPVPTPNESQELSTSPASSIFGDDEDDELVPTLKYGRHFITTARGYIGLATPGVTVGDHVAILPGGDVPVVLRRQQMVDTLFDHGHDTDDDNDDENHDDECNDDHDWGNGTKATMKETPDAYHLLCECYMQSPVIMYGDYFRTNWTQSDEITLI